jgi:hypothetical protein
MEEKKLDVAEEMIELEQKIQEQALRTSITDEQK